MNYGIKLMGRFLALSLCFVLVVSGCKSSGAATKSGKSSASTQKPPAKKGDLKKFSEVITKDAKTDEGLFNVHKVDDKYYFEIPNEMH